MPGRLCGGCSRDGSRRCERHHVLPGGLQLSLVDVFGCAFMEQTSRTWQRRHIALWLLLAGVVIWWRGPAYAKAFQPEGYPPGHTSFVPDFFLEWASARNFFEGLPLYTPQAVTLRRYLERERQPADPSFRELNAHPPTAVLLGLPLGKLDFTDAFRAWNLVSLAALAVSACVIVHQLRRPFVVWDLLPAVTFLLLCHPFWHQMVHGQLNLLLLLLLTGAWTADRNGRSCRAGALAGMATSIGLFPGLLFLYFLLRRQWRPLATGLMTLAVVTGLTAVLLGPESYRSYLVDVLPKTSVDRTDWPNLSLSGVW